MFWGVYHFSYPRNSGITAGNAGAGLRAGGFPVFLGHKLSIEGFGNSNIGERFPSPYLWILTF